MNSPLEHTAALPLGFKVTFIWIGGNMNVEWEPEFPCIRNPRQLRKFTAAYLQARDEFMQTVATMMQGAVAVADMQGNVRVIAPEVIQ
ncbi:hypothetical protein [Phyllobacterium chamaecytisi]|uniref:hypothetical protein n=1 Tax=Phyllobacterium chamaecytisi TaxID=2876082 RepID=UPI001CC91206|nr:hypothetical protein [Phyllobacterium sp. KW56]MBZ9603994.1 hypothetical protein [Phyllobacterium sp. KW56]